MTKPAAGTLARENTERYKELFQRNLAGMYTIGLDGEIKDCNPAFARILGFDLTDELIGVNVINFYLDASGREVFLQKLQSEKELNNYEITLCKRTGEVIVCLENSFLLDSGGHEPTINGVIIEVTDEKILAEKYKGLFTTSDNGILFFTDGVLKDVNKRAGEMLDYTMEELMSGSTEQLLEYLREENEDIFELLLMKVDNVRSGEMQSIKLRIKRKDGTVFHARVGFFPFKAIGKRYTQVVINDISERVLFEQTIKESEARFRTLSKVAIEGIVFVHENIIVDCNEQILRMLGFDSSAKFIGKNLEDFILHPDMRRLRNTLLTSAASRSEIRAINLEGKIIHLEGSGTEIWIDNKRLEAFLLYDITARKRTENELERSREQFKGLVENSPNGVWIVMDNKVRYVNGSSLRMLGYQEEDEVYHKEFTALMPKAAQGEILKDFVRIRAGKDIEFKETEMLHRNGHAIAVSLNMTLSIYENQPAIQITINNLTLERQLIEQQLRTEMAEGVNKELKLEISNHRETQKQLLAAQRYTRNIIDSSIDMIIAVDNQAGITEFNPAALNFFGYESTEMLGRPSEVLYGDSKQYKRVLLSLQKNGVFRGEIVNRRKDGTTFTALLSASLIINDDGEVVGSMGVSRDITELKEAQERIKESEERLRDIFSNTTDFIISIDPHGQILFANRAFLENMGYTSGLPEGLNIKEITDDARLRSTKNLTEVLDNPDFKTTLVTAQGARIRVAGNAGVRYADGSAVGYRAVLRNVTKETEQSAKLNSIFESTENLHMWTLDRAHKLTGFNKNFLHVLESQFGLTLLPGDDYVEAISTTVNPDLYQNQLNSYEQVFNGLARSFELPLLNLAGENLWFQVFLNPVYIEDELQEVSCIAYDITERKTIDRKIRDALKEKEVLLKEVHHRVKNNLQVISSILSLQTSYVKDEGTLEVLKESRNRIKSMSYIHETLYQTADFSSIEFTEYIRVIAQNLVHSYVVEAGRVKLITGFDSVSLTLDQAIPCGLIANELISNALKHAFHGISDPELTVEVRAEGESVSLHVADNGRGLPPDFDYRNFDSLGVQLVYTLAEQLDAEVKVNSCPGASFVVTFGRVNP